MYDDISRRVDESNLNINIMVHEEENMINKQSAFDITFYDAYDIRCSILNLVGKRKHERNDSMMVYQII